MKYLLLIAVLTLSCATSPESQKKELIKQGYSKKDVNLVHKYKLKYLQSHARALSSRSAFDSSGLNNSTNKLRRIFCNCVKVNGEQCTNKSSGKLTGKKQLLWAKGHSAYSFQRDSSNNILLGTRGESSFDVDEC